MGALDVLCLAGSRGAIGLAAGSVGVVDEDEARPGVPAIDLAPLLGSAPGAERRRIRVDLRDRAVELVTDADLSVLSIAAASRHAVPRWIEPFLARIGVAEIALADDAVVLLADPAALVAALEGGAA